MQSSSFLDTAQFINNFFLIWIQQVKKGFRDIEHKMKNGSQFCAVHKILGAH